MCSIHCYRPLMTSLGASHFNCKKPENSEDIIQILPFSVNIHHSEKEELISYWHSLRWGNKIQKSCYWSMDTLNKKSSEQPQLTYKIFKQSHQRSTSPSSHLDGQICRSGYGQQSQALHWVRWRTGGRVQFHFGGDVTSWGLPPP